MGKTKDVRDAVEAELAFDPLVDATGITVKNLNGDVALNGTVPSYPQYLEAAAAASASPVSRTCTTTALPIGRRGEPRDGPAGIRGRCPM
jgi:BON domain